VNLERFFVDLEVVLTSENEFLEIDAVEITVSAPGTDSAEYETTFALVI
jgi:hypothetical protein